MLRDNVVVWEGKLASLRRFKDDVSEVKTGRLMFRRQVTDEELSDYLDLAEMAANQENDAYAGGTIEDNLFDGCYTFYSAVNKGIENPPVAPAGGR